MYNQLNHQFIYKLKVVFLTPESVDAAVFEELCNIATRHDLNDADGGFTDNIAGGLTDDVAGR